QKIQEKKLTTKYHYNNEDYLFKKEQTLGSCTQTIEYSTSYSNTEKTMEITTKTTYKKNSAERSESFSSKFDSAGNLISKTEYGITTEWTYFSGDPNTTEVVTTKKANNPDANTYGWLMDNSMGGIGKYIDDSGYTWGTQELHTITTSRRLTNTGKSNYNLPVDIVCPGNSNFFNVYVESEKIYTYSDNQRVDLRWTFYGYKDLPIAVDSSSTVVGPDVKPSIKLTIFDPVTDDFKKLKSWQTGAMTVETTEYFGAGSDHGRVQTLSQYVLDSAGKTVPDSLQSIAITYSQSAGMLTTNRTLTGANKLSTKSSQANSILTGDLLESIDALGNKTTYTYDDNGRLISQIEFAQSEDLRNETKYDYSHSKNIQTVTTQFPNNLKYQVQYDSLGRTLNTKCYSTNNSKWLILSDTSHDELGREKQTTEYDYRPDDSLLFSRTLVSEYNDWGALVKTQVVGGPANCSEYDPVTQQLNKWQHFGSSYYGTCIQYIDSPLGRKEEIYSHSNGIINFTSSVLYDTKGRVSEEAASSGPKRQYGYDHFDRLIYITCEGITTRYEYPSHTSAAIKTKVTIQRQGETTVYELGSRKIDGLGRISESMVGGRRQTYVYDEGDGYGKGNLVSSNVSNTAPILSCESSYDIDNGKLYETTIGTPDKTPKKSNYTYSRRGLLLATEDAFNIKTNFSYDMLGRLVASDNAQSTTIQYYNDSSQISQEEVRDKTSNKTMNVTYTYDTQLREVQREFLITGFDPLTIKRSYNEGRLASSELLKAGQSIRKEQFTYDSLGRLSDYTCAGSQKPLDPQGNPLDAQKFAYNLLGSISQCTSTSGTNINTSSYQYSATDQAQLQSITNSLNTYPDINFYHDELGRLKSNDQGTTYKYNNNSKLSFINKSDRSYTYAFDEKGREAACYGTYYYEQYYFKNNHQYARTGVVQVNNINYLRTLLLLNDSDSCVLQQQTFGPDGGARTTSNSFEIKDANGTVVGSYGLSDNSQRLFSYTPFGYRPDDWSTPNWLGFNGEPMDRTDGTYHLGNGYRAYNPRYQSFQTPDSLSPFDEGGINNYSYCSNDPINFKDPSGHAEFVQEYSVWVHAPLQADPLANAIFTGVIGIALAPLTGGSSTLLTAAAVGLAIVSAGFGIAAVLTQESDPTLSEGLGWASFGTGIASGFVAPIGAGAKWSANVRRLYSLGKVNPFLGQIVQMGGTMKALTRIETEVHTFVDSYKKLNRLNIVAHGRGLSRLEVAANASTSVVVNGAEVSAGDLLNLLTNKGVDPRAYDHVRLLVCYSGNGGANSFAQQFHQLTQRPVKAFAGEVSMKFGSTPMETIFQNAISQYGAMGEKGLTTAFADSIEPNIIKVNPYDALTSPTSFENFSYSPVYFPKRL
ncbi:hypothetical protein JFU49_09890, partial [Pseudomonas sp. TH03]|nr:hypothetical protein [Pseudomonas sp. TH03]